MVKYIAHRGNTQGPQPSFENTIEYLRSAYQDYDVEIDLIGHKGRLYLGHDEPQQPAPLDFVQSEGVWCHAKNYEAATLLSSMRTHWFWHQEDDFALTSKEFFWCFPNIQIQHPKAVWLDLGDDVWLPKEIDNIYAICGDTVNENTYMRA